MSDETSTPMPSAEPYVCDACKRLDPAGCAGGGCTCAHCAAVDRANGRDTSNKEKGNDDERRTEASTGRGGADRGDGGGSTGADPARSGDPHACGSDPAATGARSAESVAPNPQDPGGHFLIADKAWMAAWRGDEEGWHAYGPKRATLEEARADIPKRAADGSGAEDPSLVDAIRDAIAGLDSISEDPKRFARVAGITIPLVRGGLVLALAERGIEHRKGRRP